MTPDAVTVQPCGALQWMQFTQHLLFALIAWVSIGVYGSWYVLGSISHGRREGFISLHDTTYMTRPEEREAPRRLVDSSLEREFGVPAMRGHDVPQSPKDMRLAALVICGAFGVASVLILAALAWIGAQHYGTRRLVVRLLLTGGPDWTT
ncbi:MAG: hypothetical protein OXG65_05770 [Chloroflexi bacterium]|nr:hypothetical protein [Chloroflexota bacterium]